MKRIFLFIVFLAATQVYTSAQNIGPFTIVAPEDFPANVLTDCMQLLNKATRKSWQQGRAEEISSGIILKLSSSPSFTTKESFRLQSDGSNLLTISSSSTEGLVFGLYKHLRSLGFKFYLPDELYTILPTVSNPFGPKKDVVD